MVDAADQAKIEMAKSELKGLLEKPTLMGIPVLVLGNKNDLEGALTAEQLIERMELNRVTGQEVSCYSISAKNQTNIDVTLQWLLRHSRQAR